MPVVSNRVEAGSDKRNWGRVPDGQAYPFHTCGGCVPDGLDELAPILFSSMAVLGRAVWAFVKSVWLCGLPAAAAYHIGKFRNDVSLTPTLTGELGVLGEALGFPGSDPDLL